MTYVDERIRFIDVAVRNSVKVALPAAFATATQLVGTVRGCSVQKRSRMINPTIDQIPDDLEEDLRCQIVGIVGTDQGASETDELAAVLLPQRSHDAVRTRICADVDHSRVRTRRALPRVTAPQGLLVLPVFLWVEVL